MEMSLALSLLHCEAIMKPVVGRDTLLGCIRAVTFNIRASKDMNNPPLALMLCTSGEHSGHKACGREICTLVKKSKPNMALIPKGAHF